MRPGIFFNTGEEFDSTDFPIKTSSFYPQKEFSNSCLINMPARTGLI
jgi:hypothetical protein